MPPPAAPAAAACHAAALPSLLQLFLPFLPLCSVAAGPADRQGFPSGLRGQLRRGGRYQPGGCDPHTVTGILPGGCFAVPVPSAAGTGGIGVLLTSCTCRF